MKRMIGAGAVALTLVGLILVANNQEDEVHIGRDGRRFRYVHRGGGVFGGTANIFAGRPKVYIDEEQPYGYCEKYPNAPECVGDKMRR